MWQETTNPLFGTTNNPYDTTRNVGGSSGGESSLLAAGGVPLGLGKFYELIYEFYTIKLIFNCTFFKIFYKT